MQTAEELLKKAQSLNQEKRYQEVNDLLTDNLLNDYKNVNLFAEKAAATYELHNYELSNHYAEKALDLDDTNAKANLYKGMFFHKNYDLDKALQSYLKATATNRTYSYAYQLLGNVYKDSKDYERAIEAYSEAIKINPNYSNAYYGLGTVYRSLNNYKKAKEYYHESIKYNDKDPYPYNGLGNIYIDQKDSENAISSFKKAIKIAPLFFHSYIGLANVYSHLDDQRKAISNLNKSIKINPSFNLSYYNRGLVFQKIGSYKKALSDFNKYLELTNEKENFSYLISLTKKNIVDLENLIKNPELNFITELVSEIKDLLLFKEKCVTHYTGFSTTKALILDDSAFRLSEGTYLNDTSEGRELFNFLPPLPKVSNKSIDTEAKPFTAKPFIGSFVEDNKHDDLTLWRMYGKEEKEEARGCAITLDREALLESLGRELIPENDTDATEKASEEFNFYRVAYRKPAPQSYFIIPGLPDSE